MSNSSDTNNSSTERPIFSRSRIRCDTTVKRMKFEYIWTISDYMSAFINRGKSELKSSWLSATKKTCKFHIQLELNDYDLLVYIVPEYTFSATKEGLIEIETSFAVMNSEGQRSHALLKTIVLGSSSSYEIGSLCKKSNLIKNKSKWLPQDKLTICCDIIFVIQEENVEDYDYPESSYVIPLQVKNFNLDGFEKLFNSRKFCDVTIHVNGKEFPAHKSILAGRSEVFAAMLQHEMKESQMNRIDIKDIDDKVFSQALRFIYTGKVENIEESAFELLPVADKYNLKELKVMCGETLYKKLSRETVVNILVLADVYNLEALKSHAIRYVRKFSTDVLKEGNSESWANLLSRPNLLKSVFLECLK